MFPLRNCSARGCKVFGESGRPVVDQVKEAIKRVKFRIEMTNLPQVLWVTIISNVDARGTKMNDQRSWDTS